MDVELQSKLLRVLQEKEVSRIGGSKSIPLDVRIIAATNKPLDIMVEKGQFRQDLFFRLNVIDIKLPPLRHIKEDIPLIIDDAITKMNRIFGKFVKGIEDSALEALLNYDWPGNVRELLNCIERAFNIIGRDEFIKEEHLSLKFNRSKIDTDAEEVEDLSLNELITNYEKKVIERVLKDVKGVKNKAAKRLKISTTTLWRKIKELGIED
jgi:transcriptional regulator with PAS, ATPase and Fis domain